MRSVEIARLRHAFGLTLAQAVLVAALAYGEGVSND